jgi:DNA-binding MarR family transcriptional regulator
LHYETVWITGSSKTEKGRSMKPGKIDYLRRQIRALEREIFEQLKGTACCGVSLAQCHAVLEIGDSKTSNVSDLAEKLKLDKSTLSRTIEGLVRLNLVSREINTEDRRYMCVTLTPQGEQVYRSINQFCNQYYHTVFGCIPEEKHEQILESLKILAESMQSTRERHAVKADQSALHSNHEDHHGNQI